MSCMNFVGQQQYSCEVSLIYRICLRWLVLVLQGEKLEDDIIEIATVLREKADKMVAETGAINFEVIQPMIDEIAVLKSKYK